MLSLRIHSSSFTFFLSSVKLVLLIVTAYMLHIDTDICYRVIDTAASQLTKTAITVTAIFIVALGYGSWYYLVGYSGATEYKFNTPLQIIG